jgi:hypothetical protein
MGTSKAYVETTVLTDALLKPGSKKEATAKAALNRYSETLLPVYSIKELKAGPLDYYSYVHDKLVQTHSFARTFAAINSLNPVKYGRRKSTYHEALAAAVQLDANSPTAVQPGSVLDEELADRYRLSLAVLITLSWQKRRKVTTETIQDLECYTEVQPMIGKDGFFDLSPKKCADDRPCCLWDELKLEENKSLLTAMRDAIPETAQGFEDKNRRKVLKHLINTPKLPLDREQCRQLGDAVFAFFCPQDADILTTNIRDHRPLAKALGKRARKP